MRRETSFTSREDDFVSSRTESPISLVSVPTTFEYLDEPIQLIYYNESSKQLQVGQEALEFLKSLPSPLSIISVAGLYRTGKSYLLNRVLLNRKSGFGVGPTVNPCTKGIWIWGRPLTGSTPDGQPCSILVIDTEGLGALDQDTDHDSRIFSLALLISSSFIYNSVGSIDEEALSNLSLVINITKHIHIKSRQKEELDSQDYAPYFPSFLWVVRDFSLKLIDNDGDAITSKEYLEKALQTQKGFSDAAEEKNRVRRLLKDFFQDRDCCTLVRPVSNESDLQNLQEKEFEELRLEFVEQVLQLRKKVMQGAKVKVMNGKVLNGEILATLVENYVSAMNKGVAPSIETAWSYICKKECGKAVQDALEVYEKTLMSSISVKFPVYEEELNSFHKEAKRNAMQLFKSKAVGTEVDEYLDRLKSNFSEKLINLKAENEAECEKKCAMMLNNAYSTIEQKLRNNEYKFFNDFEKDIKKLQRFFKERGPEGPYREEILLEFCQKKVLDTADYFLKEIQNENEYLQTTYEENLKLVESELKESKEDAIRERNDWQKRLTSAESERAELTAKENSLKEQLLTLKNEKDKTELELRTAMKNLRLDLSSQVESANNKSWEFEEKMKETERLSLQKDSEYQEQVALMEQKLKYLESSLEESRRREKEFMNESKSQKRDHSSSLKDIQSRFDSQLKNLQARLDGEIERVSELERELEEKERIYERDKQKWENDEIRFKAIVDEKTSEATSLSQELRRKEKDSASIDKKKTKEYENNLERINKKLEETEKKLKGNEESSKDTIKKLAQENAILSQKLDFNEQQLSECKNQLEEERKQHSNMLLSISNGPSTSNSDIESSLQKLRDQYIDEMRALEVRSDSTRRELSKNNDLLSQKNTELELELKCLGSELNSKVTELQASLAETTEERNKLKESLADFKSKAESNYAETEGKLKKKMTQLEKELESEKTKHLEEIKVLTERSEASYAQLKEFYEAEKKRLENRLQDEKERAEKKYNLMIEEFEDRIRRETEEFEDELQLKDDELRDLDAYYNDEINSLRHQSGLDLQKVESLEKYLKESKDQIENMQKAHSLALEQAQERINSERTILVEKIDKLVNEVASKERDIAACTYKKEQIQELLIRKDSEIEELKSIYEKDKLNLTEKAESFKSQFLKVSDEFVQKRNDFKREMALAMQEIDFKNRKIVDLERSVHDSEEKYNEAIKSLRDESGQELSATIQKLSQAKESLELKLDQKKKDLKEMSTSSSKQIGCLEKEKAVLSEKLIHLEAKFSEAEERYKQDILNLNNKLKEKKDAESSDKMSVHIENERLKTLLQELEKDAAERATASDRERILWENKHNFLLQQRDSAKSDLSEAQKKFDLTLEQLQKKSVSDKEKFEGNTNTLLSSIEARYSNQIKDMQDNLQGQISVLTLKNKALEKESRSLKEELEVERRGRSANAGNLEKKLQELQENESRLTAEIEALKREKEKKIEEMQDSLLHEKDQLKVKISELEKRTKEAEHQKGLMFIEHEKERAKWNTERDHIITQRNEALENLERVEKRKETLLRENEKLRVEKGKNRALGGMFTRKPDGNNSQITKGISGLFSQAGVTFEEFAREKNQEEASSPGRQDQMVSPVIGGKKISFLERRRSGVDKSEP